MEIRPILSALLRNKTGAILVALQVALSLAILVNALHIVSERRDAVARPSGIADEQSVFSIGVRNLSSGGPEQQLATQKREMEVIRAVPGVAAAANVNQIPMSQSGWNNSVAIDRKQVDESAGSSFYFSPDSLIKTWGLKLVEGRDFLPGEYIEVDDKTEPNPRVAIITRALAAKLWPGTAATGKTMYFGTGEDATEVRIVGIVERLQTTSAEVTERGEFSSITPMRLYGAYPGARYTVRAEPGQRERVIREVEAALRKASPNPVVLKSTTLDKYRKDRYRADVALSWMLVTVSVLLLLITASGIVGMASLWVTQRRKQIGVRRALGARKIDILRYFVTENFMITSGGVAGGVLLGVALNQLLVSRLEMARLPLEYLVAGGIVFWALGVIAVYGPAWRAASISPALATRSA
ncbi:ABC transporter permease [Massilia sp. Se16.2.3]|uniref:ABC transporter permease n=1 Tax=Massilia sp. Se16.2.3 TaxID=2709303 RepID=UPI0016013B1E|nr:FtsX-like permease family protein [Massilia sp. Se16.2.3]QNA98480.1 FtsX-like permease family protein [Massilia sp. Se16.2.3]